jgi:hypothetical protein
MLEASKHPSDEEILQFIDHELPTNRLNKLREHLADCPECHKRQLTIEDKLKALDDFYRAEPIDSSSMPTSSRMSLQKQLAGHRRKRSTASSLISVLAPRLSIAAVAILAVAGLVFYSRNYIGKHEGISSTAQYIEPNRTMTPGAVRAVSLDEICSVHDDDLDPQVSPSIEVAVLREYGVSPDVPTAENYQIDYLVNPQLGGTNNIKNLWPQSYGNGRWNAHAKDVLEQHLHQMVCNGTISLAVAQREIADDWIAAYKKYVGREVS